MRLAIVGSTILQDDPRASMIINEVLDKYRPDVVVSGGARGIDSMAEAAAKLRGIPTEIHYPKVRAWAAPGGFRDRNLVIARECDRLVRIVSQRSQTYGSGWTRDQAQALGKPTEEFVLP